MSTFDRFKSKIKAAATNIPKFNEEKEKAAGANEEQKTQEDQLDSQSSNRSDDPGQQKQAPQVAQPTQSATNPPKTTSVKFNIETMDQYTHQELQKVVRTYDEMLKKIRPQLQEMRTKVGQLELEKKTQQEECKALQEQKDALEEINNSMRDNIEKLAGENDSTSKINKALMEKTKLLEEETQRLLGDENALKNELKAFKEGGTFEAGVQHSPEVAKPHGIVTKAQEELETDDDVNEKDDNQNFNGATAEETKDEPRGLTQDQPRSDQQDATGLKDQLEAAMKMKLTEAQKEIETLQKTVQEKDSSVKQRESEQFELASKFFAKQQEFNSMENQMIGVVEENKSKTEQLAKKERLVEQFQKKLKDLLNDKQEQLERQESLESDLKLTQEKVFELNGANDKHTQGYSEKMLLREANIERLSKALGGGRILTLILDEENKHLKSTIRSQETTISYFRKKVEELQHQIEESKQEKVNMQNEIRRIEQMSSKHSTPRNNTQNQGDGSQSDDGMEDGLSSYDVDGGGVINTDNSPRGSRKPSKNSSLMADKSDNQATGDLKIELGNPKLQQQFKRNKAAKSVSMDEIRRLREEYDTMAKEYLDIKKEKVSLEEKLAESSTQKTGDHEKWEAQEAKIQQQERLIQELEKRRAAAKNEIKMLNHKLDKTKSAGGSTTANTDESSMRGNAGGTQPTVSEVNAKMNSIGSVHEAAHLKKVKREIEGLYKDLIKVLFVEQIDKDEAIKVERKVNMLIMTVNDHIDEIEIKNRQSQVVQGALEIQKRGPRPASNDPRQGNQQPQMMQRSNNASQQHQMQQQNPASHSQRIGGFAPAGNQINSKMIKLQGQPTSGMKPANPTSAGGPVRALHGSSGK